MGLFGNLFQTVNDLESQTQILKQRAYGIIEIRDQEFHSVRLRPFPKLITRTQVRRAEARLENQAASNASDRVLLFYNQPMFHDKFLALKYLYSTSGCSLPSIAVSLSVLDYIARIKKTDAIVTEISNDKIQDRHLAHFGWQRHCPDSSRRHWIKRFYGRYPNRFLFQTAAERSAAPAAREPALV